MQTSPDRPYWVSVDFPLLVPQSVSQSFAHLSWFGCCKKMPETGWLVHKRNVFLLVLEAGDHGASQHGQVLGGPCSGLQTVIFSLYFLEAEGDDRALWGLSYMDTNLIHECFTLMTQLPPKGPTS